MVRKSGVVLVLLVLTAGAQFACSIPPVPPERVEPTPERSPTTGETVMPTPGALRSPTGSAPTPPLPSTEGQGLTWLASGVYRVGQPEEGWQKYQVTLAYENTSDGFMNERVTCESWGPQINTQEGYAYEHRVDGWSVSCVEDWAGWGIPWPGDCQYYSTLSGVPTGVIPPGFRIRGAVTYNWPDRRACVAQITLEFKVGELLHPDRVVLRPSTVVSLSEVPESYGPMDPSGAFDSLPATIDMGKAQVTIDKVVLRTDGLVEIRLEYENRDPGREWDLRNPVVGLIDSQGYLSTPGSSWGDDFSYRYFDRQCGNTVPIEPDLGPMQRAQYQTCLPLRPGATPEERFFLVACGWTEQAEQSDSNIGFEQKGAFNGIVVYPEHKDCYVYEVSISQ